MTVNTSYGIVRFSWKYKKNHDVHEISNFSWLYSIRGHCVEILCIGEWMVPCCTGTSLVFFKKYNREILFFETFYVPGNLQSGQNSSKTDDYWLYPRQHSSELPGSLLTRPICRLICLTSLLRWLKLEFHPIKCQGAAWWAMIGNFEFFNAEHPNITRRKHNMFV